MPLDWRLRPPRLFERCDSVVRLRDISLDGTPQTPSDLADATPLLVVKPYEAAGDDTGRTYTGTVAVDPDADDGRAQITFTVPAADLAEPGERWGYAVLDRAGGRYAVGYGPVFVQGM